MEWRTLIGLTIIFHAIIYAWKKEWVLRLDTRKLNPYLNSIGNHQIRKYLRPWFRLGSYATVIIGFPLTFFLFLRTIFYAILPSVVSIGSAVASVTSTLAPVESTETHLEPPNQQYIPFPDVDLTVEVEPSPSESSTYLAIQPVFPGWNLPLTHLPYYLLAILISVVVHELAHAIASASHKIPIQSVGITFLGPLIPAAHVELNSIQLRETPIRKQLDILTAGVWMNVYLSIITYFVVPRLLPVFLYPTHSMGTGITVTNVWTDSGIGGPGGLHPGDVVTGIENCKVNDLKSWYVCLETIWESDPVGYCVTDENLSMLSNNTEGCCGTNQDNSYTHLCFLQVEDLTKTDNHVQKGDNSHQNISSNLLQPDHPIEAGDHAEIGEGKKTLASNNSSYCMPAQSVVTESFHKLMKMSQYEEHSESFKGWEGRCHSPSYKCSQPRLELQNDIGSTGIAKKQLSSKINANEEVDSEVAVSNSQSQCFLPRLVKDVNKLRIVQIQRHQNELKVPVLFIGSVLDIFNGFKPSEFVPRTWFLSKFFGFSSFSRLPEKVETVFLLTAGLSAGLAVVNMLPIYGLDGYHIVDAMARAYFVKKWEPRKIAKFVQLTSWFALFIAALTVFCSIARVL